MSASRRRSVLVLTVVHHPHDARIRHRQIAALLEAGWQVTYAAPWAGHGVPPERDTPGLTCVDVTRAVGRHRLGAQRSARALLRRIGPQHDLVLLHDPELVPTTLGLRLPPVVWDVHEDTAAAVEVRPWVPDRLRPVLSTLVTRVERLAERHTHLLLADGRYAGRFARQHPVVPNSTRVPADPPDAGRPGPDGKRRVVYLGSVTMERGAAELVEVGRRLTAEAGARVRLEVLGPAHGSAEGLLRAAQEEGVLDWSGFVPNPEALARVEGALAGLSLLHDAANFRPSMPTKVVEYLARAVPAITTPLPLAAELVDRSGGGVVVPFQDVDGTVAQLLRWLDRPEDAVAAGRRGHALVQAEQDWAVHAPAFVAVLEQLADEGAATAVRRVRRGRGPAGRVRRGRGG